MTKETLIVSIQKALQRTEAKKIEKPAAKKTKAVPKKKKVTHIAHQTSRSLECSRLVNQRGIAHKSNNIVRIATADEKAIAKIPKRERTVPNQNEFFGLGLFL